MSTLVFTGRTLSEVNAHPLAPAILSLTDVLIAGRYDRRQHLGRGLLGSSNQRIHLLSDRYSQADFDHVPVREVIVHRDGGVTLTGMR